MTSPLLYAIGCALLMAGLLVEVTILRAIHTQPRSIHRLFALRDKLIRLVIEGKIERREPHFDAIYRNVNIILDGSSRLSGDRVELAELPHDSLPVSLEPTLLELRYALEQFVEHHFELNVLIDRSRRESTRIQKARAKAWLKMMPDASPSPA